MQIYIKDNNEYIKKEIVEKAEKERIMEIYSFARGKYTIEEITVNWADDDDFGYYYNDSHLAYREPKLSELVFYGDELYGFLLKEEKKEYVYKKEWISTNIQYVLEINGSHDVSEPSNDTGRHAFYMRWKLIIEEEPNLAKYVYIKAPDELHAEDISPELLTDCETDDFASEKIYNPSNSKLFRLTNEASNNIIETMDKLKANELLIEHCKPWSVRVSCVKKPYEKL